MFGRITDFVLSKPALAIAVGVSLLTAVGVGAVWIYAGSIANDFSVYWRTANEPLEFVYWAEYRYPFPYMPTMLLWIAPLKTVPLWPAFLLWVCASVLAIACACRPYLPRNGIWLLLISPPITNGLLTGQVAAVLAAALLWACGTRRRVAAGIAFGIIASIKPQLVVMAPLLLLLRKDWTALAFAAASFFALLATSLALFGADMWLVWMHSLAEFRSRLTESTIIESGATPAAFAENFGLDPVPFMILGAAVGAYLVYRCRNLGPLETAAAIGAASILAAPYALTYDLAVVAPFLVLAVLRGRVVSAVALTGVIAPLTMIVTAYELLTRKAYKKEPVENDVAPDTDSERALLPGG